MATATRSESIWFGPTVTGTTTALKVSTSIAGPLVIEVLAEYHIALVAARTAREGLVLHCFAFVLLIFR